MNQPNKNLERQGDLLFEKLEGNSAKFARQNYNRTSDAYRKDGIIQEGEATGHHHCIDPELADVFRPRWGQPIIVVGKEAAPVIQKVLPGEKGHDPVMLEPDSVYQITIAREFDPTGEIRQVVD